MNEWKKEGKIIIKNDRKKSLTEYHNKEKNSKLHHFVSLVIGFLVTVSSDRAMTSPCPLLIFIQPNEWTSLVSDKQQHR